MAERSPHDARWLSSRVTYLSRHGYVQVANSEVAEGLVALEHSRRLAEDYPRVDTRNDRYRRDRVIVVLLQAMAFAKWSEADEARITDRDERLVKARALLAEAEPLVSETKTKEAELFFERAQSALHTTGVQRSNARRIR